MTWLNEYEVEDALVRFDPEETPNLSKGALVLSRLKDWTNDNSDGWPYWQKPARAAGKLMEALESANTAYYRGAEVADLTDAELAALLRPIKAFLARQGVEHGEVLL